MPAHSTTCTDSDPPTDGWKNKGPYKMPNWDLSDDIVISGFSGRFPESNNVDELKKHLFEGTDMITENDRRWKPGIFGTPKRTGKLKEVDQFDMMFFGVHGKQADAMDPMHRLIVESTYEAIFDAGYEPSTLRNKNIGVFVGCSDRSMSDNQVPEDMISGYELLGNSIAMLANRVSFTFGFSGPSMSVDTACSSTLHALNEAILAMRTNRCDAAIVGGGMISLSVALTVSFTKLGLVSKDGTCKVFDKSANGYVRSEAVGAIFLQKASDARRCYATILHCKLNNDGAKAEGISYPSSDQHKQLFKEVFSELNMDPTEVDFVEAHGTGTTVGDKQEGNAIAEFFCPGRKTPLLVGSVKSNLGHAEAASGLCSIGKIILSIEEGFIAPNLHYFEPNPEIPLLMEGKMKVVSEKTPWKPRIISCNNFGFGGSNANLILKANQKEKPERKERTVPRLAFACGRNESAVQYIFQNIKEKEFTDEALVLLEEACKSPTQGMSYRGYALVQNPGEELNPDIKMAPVERRPVWFLFSGMGSQWSGMAKDMMQLDVFAKSIQMSDQILKPYGLDLIYLLTEAPEKEFNNIIFPFVTIAAVQIALVELIRSLGISPDGIVGHSVGELGCAYADGCFTAEQMLLAAYWRGKSCTQVQLISGAMAAVGMSWEEAQRRVPEGVYPVCNNSEDSVTISGPADAVKKFVEELKAENVFAKMIKTCDIAFHCKYIEPASHIMTKELTKVIPNPLPRSHLWVSSSVPESEWDAPHAKLSSVDYHVNNLLSPVYFNEAMTKVPKNAIIIEFAPHSLLQPIVKNIIGPEAVYISFMKRQSENNLLHCLNSIGKMYTSGMNPSAKNLYEPISYPVPRGTPMLNSLIQWNHSMPVNTWTYDKIRSYKNTTCMDTTKGMPNEYLLGHKVDGRILFPFMGYVYLAWKALAKELQLEIDELPVLIEDFSVHRATLLPKSGHYLLNVHLVNCDGSFRITDMSSSIVASGKIFKKDQNVLRTTGEIFATEDIEGNEKLFELNTADFYKELRLRGYEYGPTFQGVVCAHSSGLKGKVRWENRWVSFMDSMLQILILQVVEQALLLPTRVKNIRIDPSKMPKTSGEEVIVECNPNTNICRAGPVEIQGMHCGIAPKRVDRQSFPVLEESTFVPYFDCKVLTTEELTEVEEYTQACSSCIFRILSLMNKKEKEISLILNGYKEVPEDVIQELIKNDDNKYVLLRVLKEILDAKPSENSIQDISTEVLSKHNGELQHDLLATLILNERALRSALDVVQTNQFHPKMQVLEVSTNAVICKDILKMLNMTSLGMMKIDYVVSRISKEPILEGEIEGSTKSVTTDIDNGALPPENDLVVAKDIFTDMGCKEDLLMVIVASLKARGFVLLVERTSIKPPEKFVTSLSGKQKHEQNQSELEELFKKCGLALICKKEDQISSVLYLLRKRENVLENDDKRVVIPVSDEDGFPWINDLKTAIKENEENKTNTKIWLTANKPSSGIIGFLNCAKQEPGGKNLRCLFDYNIPPSKPVPKFPADDLYFKDILSNDLQFNVIKNDQWGMFCHKLLEADAPKPPHKYAFINVTKRGDLSSITWIQNPVPKPSTDLVPVDIYYSALNFRDVMLASGKLPPGAIPASVALQECVLGLELVGRDPTGRRVMGFALSKALATHIDLPKDSVLEVPEFWSMEEASSVPVVYLTSYYALIIRGQMKPGESILIHSGTGGVGQAAIRICLSMGCQVFTTVGSDEKKEFLKSVFPEIKENQIFNSRDVAFEDQIMNATKGKGVDLVLNSLADDKLQASIRCVRQNGRFLEIGKYDIAMNSNLGMAALGRNITFHAVFLDVVLDAPHDNNMLPQLKELMKDGINRGVVKPIKTNVFAWDQAEEAFRFFASGKHIGKVVIKIRDEEPQRKVGAKSVTIPALPRTYCDADKSYVVTGGLGGFGFELVSWLVEKGARKVVLSARSPVKNMYQKLWIQRWENAGVQVKISNEDISSIDGIKKIIISATVMGQVGGVFHLAMVLSDGLLENLQPEDFEKVFQPKAQTVRNLDKVTREICPKLDYFVVFSSISCGRGNPGQSNYGYANSVMERVVELRKEDGLPGLAIQWGGIGDVGVVYEKMGGNEVILKGTIPQRLNSCFPVLERFMEDNHVVISSFVPAEKAAFSLDPNEDVVVMLCRVLGVKDPSSVKPEMTLGELGMDSLMGVEIKQVLETEYDTILSVPEVRQLSIKELEEIGKKKKSSFANQSSENTGKVDIFGEMYIPTETIIPMAGSGDPRFVFLIHPMEGHVKMLQPLARNLKCKVLGLQFTDNVPCNTIQDIAVSYVQEIKSVQPFGPYRLVGFSYGTLIAFEMALILQKTDLVKSFVCIDGSPKAVTELCQTYVTKADTEKTAEYRNDGILIFLREYFNNVPTSVINAFRDSKGTDTSIELQKLMIPLLGENFDVVLATSISERCFKLCRAAVLYKTEGKFKGRITLIKATEGLRPLESVKLDDFGLREIIDGDVEVFAIKCEHKVIAEDSTNEVSKIINDRI